MRVVTPVPADPSTAHDDRRRGPRVTQSRPVKVFDPASSRYVSGKTCDVSPSGLRLELPVSSPILPGRLIHIHVGISTGTDGLVQRIGMLPARVVWIDRTQGKTLTTGVELVAGVAASAITAAA